MIAIIIVVNGTITSSLECSECTNRVLEGEIAYQGHGHAQFISHDALLHYNNNQLLHK